MVMMLMIRFTFFVSRIEALVKLCTKSPNVKMDSFIHNFYCDLTVVNKYCFLIYYGVNTNVINKTCCNQIFIHYDYDWLSYDYSFVNRILYNTGRFKECTISFRGNTNGLMIY